MSFYTPKYLRANIKDNFVAHFSSLGYQPSENRRIIPDDDPTVLFCGATISMLKNKIREQPPVPGRWVAAQRCLRLHALGSAKLDADRPYLSYFEMVSVLSTQSTLAEFFDDVLNYTLPVIHRHEAELEIWVRSEDECFQTALATAASRHSFQLIRGRQQKYDWTYGEPGLSGVGCLFHLARQGKPSYEFGQIIQLMRNGTVIGYEFGFGIETFSSFLLGGADSYASCLAKEIFDLSDDSSNRALLDHLTAALAMVAEGLSPGKGKRESILRAIINVICRDFRSKTKSIDDIDEKIRCLSMEYFGTPAPANQLNAILQDKLCRQAQAEARIIAYIENQRNLVRLGLMDSCRADENIVRYEQKMRAHTYAQSTKQW